jgi:hypothetical protein
MANKPNITEISSLEAAEVEPGVENPTEPSQPLENMKKAAAENSTSVPSSTVAHSQVDLTKPLFAVVSVVLTAILSLLIANLAFQYRNYSSAISAALSGGEIVDHAVVLSYSRAWDFAVVKTSSLFLAFLLIFTGALYVLRAIEHELALDIKALSGGSLKSSSPGLVMISLGVLLVALVMYSKSYVEYKAPNNPPANVLEKPAESGETPRDSGLIPVQGVSDAK